MTLREMFPEWWCKTTLSIAEDCYGDYNWLDFSIYEFIFSVIVLLIIKWIIYCLLFILGKIIPYKAMDSTIVSPSLLEKNLDIPNYEMEDTKVRDFEFNEDVFGLEEESSKIVEKGQRLDEDLDKEIEESIVNITRKGVNR